MYDVIRRTKMFAALVGETAGGICYFAKNNHRSPTERALSSGLRKPGGLNAGRKSNPSAGRDAGASSAPAAWRRSSNHAACRSGTLWMRSGCVKRRFSDLVLAEKRGAVPSDALGWATTCPDVRRSHGAGSCPAQPCRPTRRRSSPDIRGTQRPKRSPIRQCWWLQQLREGLPEKSSPT